MFFITFVKFYAYTIVVMLKILLRIYQCIIAVPVLAVATFLTAVFTIIACALGLSRSLGYYLPHYWAKLWCILMFVKIEVRGHENIDKHTSYVFVSNHQGAYDIFLIFGYLNHNFKWMMKKSLEKIPFVGYACKVSKHIMVDRSGAAAVQRTMESAMKILQGGMSLVVFPEGTRTPDGKIRPFKRGAFMLATEFGLPIVPLTIDGSFAVMKKSSFAINPGKITLTIHKPIPQPQGERTKEAMEAMMEESYSVIKSSLKE